MSNSQLFSIIDYIQLNWDGLDCGILLSSPQFFRHGNSCKMVHGDGSQCGTEGFRITKIFSQRSTPIKCPCSAHKNIQYEIWKFAVAHTARRGGNPVCCVNAIRVTMCTCCTNSCILRLWLGLKLAIDVNIDFYSSYWLMSDRLWSMKFIALIYMYRMLLQFSSRSNWIHNFYIITS